MITGLEDMSVQRMRGLIHQGSAHLVKVGQRREDGIMVPWTEEDRIQLQQGVTGHASTSTMGVLDLRKVMVALDAKGAFPARDPQRGGKGRKPKGFANSRQGMYEWIEALLAEKRRLDGTSEPVSWRYADKIVSVQTGRETTCRMVQDADALHKVGVALQMHVRRLKLRVVSPGRQRG